MQDEQYTLSWYLLIPNKSIITILNCQNCAWMYWVNFNFGQSGLGKNVANAKCWNSCSGKELS